MSTSRRRGRAPTRCLRWRGRPRAAPIVTLDRRGEVPDHGVLHPRRVHPVPTTAEPELTVTPLPVPKAPPTNEDDRFFLGQIRTVPKEANVQVGLSDLVLPSRTT